MVKDRLGELTHNQTATQPGTNGQVTTLSVISGDQYPSFLSKCQNVDKKLNYLRDSVKNLTKVHADINASTHDKSLTEKRLRITAEIRKITFEIRDDIRNLKNDMTHMPPRSDGTARMAALQLQKLTSDLNECTVNCQTERGRFDDRVKARMRREYEILGESKTDAELSELIERENLNTFCELDEMNDAKRILDDSVQRQYEMNNLEKSVIEVHQLFLEINQLVMDQGDMLGTIEGNVNAAQTNTEAGAVVLKQAGVYRSAARRKKIYCILIVVLVLVILATIIGLVIGLGGDDD